MFSIRKVILTLSAAALLFTSCDKDDDNDEFKIGNKEGILLVTFGSTYEAPQTTFKTIDESAKAKFVGEEIRWAYTSDDILNKLRKGLGEGGLKIDNDTPKEALELMVKDGYGKIAVQSLHVIPGEEYDEMMHTIKEIEALHKGVQITVGKPLLNSKEDLVAVAKILEKKFAAQIAKGEPVLLMGHGTPHEADVKYIELEVELQKLYSKFFVGTVEGISFGENENFGKGEAAIGSIITKLGKLGLDNKNVMISPLMSVAGDHANNDMNASTGQTDPAEQSWRERLVAEGYIVADVMKGLGDYNEINAIWMSHLAEAKAKLK